MRLLFVRHGEPDYSIDSLTPRGWKEADQLAERLSTMNIKEFYVSPLGRAQDTIKKTLEVTGKEAITLDWLHEFKGRVDRPDRPGRKSVCWDWRPEDWTKDSRYYDVNQWYLPEPFQKGKVKEEYDLVIKELDAFLEAHGYQRDGFMYRPTREDNHDVICFVCHFAITQVFASHFMNCSPMILWHHTVMPPTSITSFYSEERTQGKVIFRSETFGDTSHLYKNLGPSSAARYRECASDQEYNYDEKGVIKQ